MEEVLDLSFDRLLMMMMIIYIYETRTVEKNKRTDKRHCLLFQVHDKMLQVIMTP